MGNIIVPNNPEKQLLHLLKKALTDPTDESVSLLPGTVTGGMVGSIGGGGGVGGGANLGVVFPVANYNAVTSEHVFLSDPTGGGSFTVNLYAAASWPGLHPLRIKNISTGANTVTVDANGGEKIDDELIVVLGALEQITILPDGSDWWVH